LESLAGRGELLARSNQFVPRISFQLIGTDAGARLPVVDVLRLMGGRGTDLLRFAIEVRSSSETTSH
jgi:hypothetical protein